MESFAAQLRAKGLRNTPQRRAVLGALSSAPHATVAELAAAIAGTGPDDGRGSRGARVDGLSRQGLYNVLDDLTKAGLVRCIEPAGSAARYEVRVGDNHHHLVCRRCGRVADVSCAIGGAPCLAPSEHQGFNVDEAEIIWWGTCQDCSPVAGS